jgi:hypothetical protein
MTKEKFDEIVAKCWKACNEATGEDFNISDSSMKYNEFYKNIDEDTVWNDTIDSYIEVVISVKGRDDFTYSFLEDFLDDIWK